MQLFIYNQIVAYSETGKANLYIDFNEYLLGITDF